MKKELKTFLAILIVIFIFLSLWLTIDFLYAVFNNSITNALSTFKTISLPDILMGTLIVIILGLCLYFLKWLLEEFYNFLPLNLKEKLHTLPKLNFPIISTFLIMTFLLVSLTTDQFNLITAIIATAVLFQNLLDKSQDEEKIQSTNLTINIIINQNDSIKKQKKKILLKKYQNNYKHYYTNKHKQE